MRVREGNISLPLSFINLIFNLSRLVNKQIETETSCSSCSAGAKCFTVCDVKKPYIILEPDLRKQTPTRDIVTLD